MITYRAAAKLLRSYCRELGIPVPRIRPALPSDPCDFTSPLEVRLNVRAAGTCSLGWYVRHTLGHYLGALAHDADAETSNRAADIIALLLGVVLPSKVP